MVEEVLRHPYRFAGIIYHVIAVVHKTVSRTFEKRRLVAHVHLYRSIIADKPVAEHLKVAATGRRHPNSNMVIAEYRPVSGPRRAVFAADCTIVVLKNAITRKAFSPSISSRIGRTITPLFLIFARTNKMNRFKVAICALKLDAALDRSGDHAFVSAGAHEVDEALCLRNNDLSCDRARRQNKLDRRQLMLPDF